MLDDDLRGILEKIIDGSIASLPSSSSSLRAAGEAGLDLKVKRGLDYSLGYVHGAIMASFNCSFIMIKGRAPDTYEILEIAKIINRRTDELKDAISRK